MAIDILITTDRIASDPVGRDFVAYLRENQEQLLLTDGVVYYDFPTYADYETVAHKPDALIVSRHGGIFAVRFTNGQMAPLSDSAFNAIDESLAQFCSILIGRLLKSKALRQGLSKLKFDVTPVVYVPGRQAGQPELDFSTLVHSFEGFAALLRAGSPQEIDDEAFAETRSVVEGAKALTRPQKRAIEDPKVQKHASALAKLEAEIANFDQKQRRAALVSIPGPQRIRGLAGSGKTVILAMKAAHLHLTRPDQRILITFFTRSLRASIKNMITRFYRHYRDEDPDWNQIHVRHGWGGASSNGVYADACRREGRTPINYSTAQQQARGADPFDFVCRQLSSAGVSEFYDHILIDEGQDFPSGFYELCFHLAKGARDSKNIIWAYDELQNILNVTIRSPDQLFGIDKDGEARISLERSAALLPAGAENDTVLSKCYRNQREVLVTAHALGFGIYRNIVQLLESKEHWEDVGYEVLSNTAFEVGKSVRIQRPAENNPLSISKVNDTETVEIKVAPNYEDEISWIVDGIRDFIAGGLQAEDIIVIALDDKNARSYFRSISAALTKHGISSNNILADPYSEPPFQLVGKVTLSTVYRAKGNEAAVVFAVGVDGVQTRTRAGRNKLFTAFTRTKAWLRISGVGPLAGKVCEEVGDALTHLPYLDFLMPDLKQVELIQRDLSKRSVRAKKIRDEFVRKMKSEGFTEDEIAELLSYEVADE